MQNLGFRVTVAEASPHSQVTFPQEVRTTLEDAVFYLVHYKLMQSNMQEPPTH
jgi:hypothetical protein